MLQDKFYKKTNPETMSEGRELSRSQSEGSSSTETHVLVKSRTAVVVKFSTSLLCGAAMVHYSVIIITIILIEVK